MSRVRLFLENFIVYGLGSMLVKLVPLLMLPLVTRLMPNSEYYGYSDLSNTLVSFMQPLAVMGVYDAMFRMFFDQDDDSFKRRVCSTAFMFVSGMSILISACMLFLRDSLAGLYFGNSELSRLAAIGALTVLVSGNNSIIQAPTRMLNRRRTFIVMNLTTSVLSYSISIPMLLGGEYLIALPAATLIASTATLLIFWMINRRWFSPVLFDCSLLKMLLRLGLPLMPNFLFYWVLSSADRLIIVNTLGVGAAGVFAISSKVGQVSQLIYTAFAQGWQYFAFSTMNDSDQVELNSRVFEYLGVLSLVATSFLMVAVGPLFSLVFPAEYAGGAVSAVLMFLSPLLLMLFQIAGGQFLVYKKTGPSAVMLAIGSIVNVALCFVLVDVMGIEGAAIATIAGYVVAVAGVLAILTHWGYMAVKPRFALSCAGFAVTYLVWRAVFTDNVFGAMIITILFCACLVLLYSRELRLLVNKVGQHQ